MKGRGIEEIIKKAETDKELKANFGSHKPLSSGLMDDLGVLMEEGGRSLVEVRLKDKAGDDQNKQRAFAKIFEYIEMIDALNVPRHVKGYFVKKLEAIATIQIRRD